MTILKNLLKLTSDSLRRYLQVAYLIEDSDIPTDFRSKTYAVRFLKSAPLKRLLAVSVQVLSLKSLLPYFIVRFVSETLGFMLTNNLLILWFFFRAKSLDTGRPEHSITE